MAKTHKALIRERVAALHRISHPDLPDLTLRRLTAEEYLAVLSDLGGKSDMALVLSYLEKALPQGFDPVETLIAYGGIGGPLAKRVIELVVGKKEKQDENPT